MQRPLRLRHSADFARLRESGRAWRHPLFTLSVAPNGLTNNRYGFIISKHVGNAVVRNLIRRRLREALRLRDSHLLSGYDLVIIARNAIADQSYTMISAALDEMLSRARLVKPESQKSVE